MSGYLRWLAERALGQASGVRPARRLPSVASRPSAGRDAAALLHRSNVASAETAPSGVGEQHLDAAADRPVAPRTPGEPPAATGAGGFSAGAVAHDADAPRPQPAAQPESAAAGSAAFTGAEHADRAAGDGPSPARPAMADVKTTSDVPDRRGAARLPVAPRVATRPTGNRPPDRSDAPLAAQPAPDVHIHIGRIESRAPEIAASVNRSIPALPPPPRSTGTCRMCCPRSYCRA